MTGLFVGLIFDFCAAISGNGREILFGYKSQDDCVVVLELTGDDERQDIVANGHTIGWLLFDGGAEVAIDGQRFVIPKFSGA